jgi:hypothetical protein
MGSRSESESLEADFKRELKPGQAEQYGRS